MLFSVFCALFWLLMKINHEDLQEVICLQNFIHLLTFILLWIYLVNLFHSWFNQCEVIFRKFIHLAPCFYRHFDTLRFFGPALLCFGFRLTTYLDKMRVLSPNCSLFLTRCLNVTLVFVFTLCSVVVAAPHQGSWCPLNFCLFDCETNMQNLVAKNPKYFFQKTKYHWI